jgi:hypothetical protein
MSANRMTVIIIALAAIAIVAVVASSGGIDLPSIGGGDDSEQAAESPSGSSEDAPEEAEGPAEEGEAEAEPAPEPEEIELPENPDDVRGTDSFALTRPANLRRAMRVLDKRRQRVEGVFDGLRIAPGRIDTVIIHPDDRRTNIQIRPDFEISFETTHDFPTQQDFRKGGLTARDVDFAAPARLLRAIDKQRRGNAARDIDYFVVGKSIIDFRVELTGYMRIRTPRPRYFRWEGGKAVAIG